MGFYIVPKRKMISPEKETPAITIIEQIQEGDTYYTDWWADFPFRIRIPVGEDMFDSGAINQQAMTFTSDPHPERATVDGDVTRSSQDELGKTWADMRDEAGTHSSDLGVWLTICIESGSNTDRWETIRRIILLFDTAALPNDCVISSAVLSVYGVTGETVDELGITPDINVYSSNPASNDDLISADYSSLGTTPLCDTAITYANFDDDGWNHFALNATGLTAISKTGITKLGLRNANYDVADTEPAWAASKISRFRMFTADNGSYIPRLTVTYEEYGGGVWIEGEKLHIISQTGTEQLALNESTFDANTILKADSDDTPEALTVAVQRIIGRITAGEIDALTGAQILTILTGQADATFSWNSQALTSVSELTLVPKASSSGAEGTIFYDSGDDHVYVGTE